MIIQRKKSLRIAEFWGDERPEVIDVDIIRRFQMDKPVPGMFCREFFTILIDLTRPEEQIFEAVKKDSRYEIRRAQTKDDLRTEMSEPDGNSLREFCDYFDEFARQKAQPTSNRVWLNLLMDAGLLRLSKILEADGHPLVWHSYHYTNRRATLLNSASMFRGSDDPAKRNMIGRANRLLHWHDILSFKNAEIDLYDFGGWYEGTTNTERLKINHFKEEFGGEIVKNYICEQAMSLKGKMFLSARRMFLGRAI